VEFIWDFGEKTRSKHLGRSRGRWEDNIKMKLREIEQGGMDWISLPQDRDQ
jgi:hypothetical protein